MDYAVTGMLRIEKEKENLCNMQTLVPVSGNTLKPQVGKFKVFKWNES